MIDKLAKTLKFIFPEYQIIESVKTYGFYSKAGTNTQQQAIPSVSAPTIAAGNTVTQTSARQATQPASPVATQKQSVLQQQVPAKTSTTPTSTAAQYSGKTETKVSSAQVEPKIAAVKTSVMSNFVGQTEAVDNLMVAIKRPLVTGFQEGMLKNTFFIIGREGSGRHTLLVNAVNAAKREGLLNYADISRVNLALYPTASEKSLFLSDIYKALYEKSDVVLFDSFENCHADMLNIISNLVTQGKYQFSERYTDIGGNLFESTDVLMPASVSEMKANGKYFVFITKLPESKITDVFGAKFMNKVADIILMRDYAKNEIVAVTNRILAMLLRQAKSNLAFELSISNTFLYHCVSKYKANEGFEPVYNYVRNEAYKALSEYKLRGDSAGIDKNVYLDYDAGADEITIMVSKQGKNETITLKPYMPVRRTSNIDEVKAELSEVIGLSKVKEYVLDLENNLQAQRLREEAGNKAASLSRHMVFTGNPGTGKTTIARIVAKYFKAIGLLSTGQLREVSRSDLVGQYVGHTAKQTNEVIQSALGGVLFIDEAYALCRDKHDTYGLEAVDALVKAVEDYRDDLVVIMAGYQDEMQDFLKNNPGLKSRFPNIIEFEDYTADEMVQIALVTAKAKGYSLDNDCFDGLGRLFEKSQVRGRNDSGNGRLVRNVIESAILEQSKRITKRMSKDEMNTLLPADFNFDSYEQFDLDKSLAGIIGLENVKELVRAQHSLLIADEKRRKAGVVVDTSQSLNMVFVGNAGTGKTTIARVIASMLKDMGVLKKGHLIETDRGGLVAEYVGQTAKKTEEVFREALGGVLFIDEAYSLAESSGGYGKEAIDTLVKLIEDYRGEIAVILAGYPKEMTDFLKFNPGLHSRFPLVIDFPDYNVKELCAIAEKMVAAKGFTLESKAEASLREQIAIAHKTSNKASGNGRMVRNIVEKIMRNQSARIASTDDVTKEMLTEIVAEDIQVERAAQAGFDLEETFSNIVGLGEVKDYVRSLAARLKIQNERKKMGLRIDNAPSLHMVFKGNPGTGKTMIARAVADVLYNLGVINTNKLIETDRAGLVAGYVGQTALKTTEKIMEAMDGVMFIDEAYSLAQGGANDFGREAIDTLVKLMDDNRERLVVMLAGYSENMNEFLKSNPGLRSRFPNIIEFPDYTVGELLLIAKGIYSSGGYTLSGDAENKLEAILQGAAKQEAFGNGRYVRNLFERSVNRQSLRLSANTDLTREMLAAIEADDIERV